MSLMCGFRSFRNSGRVMSRLFVALTLIVAIAGSASGQSQSSRVVGRVVDAETGEPVRGVRLMLTPGGAPAARIPAGAPIAAPSPVAQSPLPRPIETNAAGVFEFEQVPTGRWRIRAQGAGYVAAFLDLFEVSGSRVVLPDIRLDRGGVITGQLLDAKGNPFSGMLVRDMKLVRLPDGRVVGGGGDASVMTNDRGEFRLAGLQPGQHLVIAQAPVGIEKPGAAAPITYVPTFYPGFADEAVASPINVRSGATTNGIDFSMLALPAYMVSGTVVDAAGRPLRGVTVMLMARGTTLQSIPSRPSEADGTFRITNVPSGRFFALPGISVKNGTSTSTRYGPRDPSQRLEIVIQGADLSGVRVVVIP
jgi:hypothetical protein